MIVVADFLNVTELLLSKMVERTRTTPKCAMYIPFVFCVHPPGFQSPFNLNSKVKAEYFHTWVERTHALSPVPDWRDLPSLLP